MPLILANTTSNNIKKDGALFYLDGLPKFMGKCEIITNIQPEQLLFINLESPTLAGRCTRYSQKHEKYLLEPTKTQFVDNKVYCYHKTDLAFNPFNPLEAASNHQEAYDRKTFFSKSAKFIIVRNKTIPAGFENFDESNPEHIKCLAFPEKQKFVQSVKRIDPVELKMVDKKTGLPLTQQQLDRAAILKIKPIHYSSYRVNHAKHQTNPNQHQSHKSAISPSTTVNSPASEKTSSTINQPNEIISTNVLPDAGNDFQNIDPSFFEGLLDDIPQDFLPKDNMNFLTTYTEDQLLEEFGLENLLDTPYDTNQMEPIASDFEIFSNSLINDQLDQTLQTPILQNKQPPQQMMPSQNAYSLFQHPNQLGSGQVNQVTSTTLTHTNKRSVPDSFTTPNAKKIAPMQNQPSFKPSTLEATKLVSEAPKKMDEFFFLDENNFSEFLSSYKMVFNENKRIAAWGLLSRECGEEIHPELIIQFSVEELKKMGMPTLIAKTLFNWANHMIKKQTPPKNSF